MPAERDRPRDSARVQRPDGPVGREQAGVVTAATAVLNAGAGTASTALLGVLADVPVAVLLIDRSAGEVTYANSAAVELAGNVRLPVGIDTWGASVGLTDLGGQPLASTSGPLSLVAQGQPVSGEAVRMAPGHGVEPDGDRLLWVTGFPLSRPDGDEHLSLVVFLELEGAGPDRAGDQLQALRELAVVATDIAFTITDPREPDDPWSG
ncbi:MAG: hypothetical protein M3Q47_13400 [Actinomycetota bacterium]|nr:hypothetical protein [Actinomycetota bacterium]